MADASGCAVDPVFVVSVISLTLPILLFAGVCSYRGVCDPLYAAYGHRKGALRPPHRICSSVVVTLQWRYTCIQRSVCGVPVGLGDAAGLAEDDAGVVLAGVRSLEIFGVVTL